MSTSKTKKAGKSSAKQQKTIVKSTQSLSVVKPGIRSWVKDNYTPTKGAAKWTDKECFEHTLKKYQATTAETLAKYQLKKDGPTLAAVADSSRPLHLLPEDKKFVFDHANCSLCAKYYYRIDSCSSCPLGRIKKTCGKTHKDPYSVFIERDNPEPMILLMEKLIAQCDKKGNWRGPK